MLKTLVAVLWLLGLSSEGAAVSSRGQAANVYCGPAAIQFVLKWYGTELGLPAIVAQTKLVEDGMRFGDLEEFLQRHGIRTHPVGIPEGCIVKWDKPVVLYGKNAASGRGHFSVQLPYDGGERIEIWDVPLGRRSVHIGDPSIARAEVALLTSTTEILGSTGVLVRGRTSVESLLSSPWSTIALSGLVVVTLVGFIPWNKENSSCLLH